MGQSSSVLLEHFALFPPSFPCDDAHQNRAGSIDPFGFDFQCIDCIAFKIEFHDFMVPSKWLWRLSCVRVPHAIQFTISIVEEKKHVAFFPNIFISAKKTTKRNTNETFERKCTRNWLLISTIEHLDRIMIIVLQGSTCSLGARAKLRKLARTWLVEKKESICSHWMLDWYFLALQAFRLASPPDWLAHAAQLSLVWLVSFLFIFNFDLQFAFVSMDNLCRFSFSLPTLLIFIIIVIIEVGMSTMITCFSRRQQQFIWTRFGLVCLFSPLPSPLLWGRYRPNHNDLSISPLPHSPLF